MKPIAILALTAISTLPLSALAADDDPPAGIDGNPRAAIHDDEDQSVTRDQHVLALGLSYSHGQAAGNSDPGLQSLGFGLGGMASRNNFDPSSWHYGEPISKIARAKNRTSYTYVAGNVGLGAFGLTGMGEMAGYHTYNLTKSGGMQFQLGGAIGGTFAGGMGWNDRVSKYHDEPPSLFVAQGTVSPRAGLLFQLDRDPSDFVAIQGALQGYLQASGSSAPTAGADDTPAYTIDPWGAPRLGAGGNITLQNGPGILSATYTESVAGGRPTRDLTMVEATDLGSHLYAGLDINASTVEDANVLKDTQNPRERTSIMGQFVFGGIIDAGDTTAGREPPARPATPVY